jgi:pantothenate kinase
VASIEDNAFTVADAVRRAFATQAAGRRRFIVAIAGPPGSGKSTLADAVVEALNSGGKTIAAAFPMDGYHFDDAILIARGDRPRKGAPHTFDVDGYRAMLDRLRNEPDKEIALPVFDRDLELSRGSARLISTKMRIIVSEGNYLLHGEAPWNGLAQAFDFTVFIRESEAELRRRLEARWLHYGFTSEQLAVKMEGNEMPNVRLVLEKARKADLEVGGAAIHG